MPHFKCLACKTRLHSAAGPDDLVGDLCPGCGSLLEPVGELAEIVGFRAIKHRDSTTDDRPPSAHQRIAGPVDGFFARREAILAERRLDAGRWADDGRNFSPEALAESMALPTPRENP
jgi:hypothetical protein